MNDIKTFIEELVNIEFIEDVGAFGYYPFQLLSEDSEGKLTIAALALGGDVTACYNAFKACMDEGGTRIYMAVDFPSGYDIEHDFVAVFQYEDGEVNLLAIPYSTKTGETFEQIRESTLLTRIMGNFKYVTKL